MGLILLLTFALLLYPLTRIIYNLFLHPLSHFPGPLIYRSSRLPIDLTLLTGRIGTTISSFHTTHGPVIRIAPNELIFSSSQAAKDVYGKKGFLKDPVAYTQPPNGTHSILTVVDDGDHARYRRLLSHAFSDRALQEQAPLIKQYVDLLITRLHQSSLSGPQDLVNWFNYIAFDIIGDLTLGESFSCLESSKSHPWVTYLMTYFKSSSFLAASRRYPIFAPLLMKFIPKEILTGRMQHAMFTKEKVEARMERGSERGDFMSGVLRHNEKETGMSKPEIIATFAILLLAGSETTATLLSAVTYYLLKNPSPMSKLSAEIRGSFENEDAITQISVNKLVYLRAVLEEALRMHPPAPRGGPRIVPKGGVEIDGIFVPEGTNVTVSIYSSSHQPRNFTDPETFAPERWLDDRPSKYASDDRAASQPWSLGPRNCIGRNLANAEMRLILTRLIWNFDMQLEEESRNWGEGQKMYNMWDKPALMVRLTSVR